MVHFQINQTAKRSYINAMPARRFGFKAPFKAVVDLRRKRQTRMASPAKPERDAIGRFVIHDGLQRYSQRSSSTGVTSPRPHEVNKHVPPRTATQEQNKENEKKTQKEQDSPHSLYLLQKGARVRHETLCSAIYRQAQEANKCNIAFVEEAREVTKEPPVGRQGEEDGQSENNKMEQACEVTGELAAARSAPSPDDGVDELRPEDEDLETDVMEQALEMAGNANLKDSVNDETEQASQELSAELQLIQAQITSDDKATANKGSFRLYLYNKENEDFNQESFIAVAAFIAGEPEDELRFKVAFPTIITCVCVCVCVCACVCACMCVCFGVQI